MKSNDKIKEKPDKIIKTYIFDNGTVHITDSHKRYNREEVIERLERLLERFYLEGKIK